MFGKKLMGKQAPLSPIDGLEVEILVNEPVLDGFNDFGSKRLVVGHDGEAEFFSREACYLRFESYKAVSPRKQSELSILKTWDDTSVLDEL